uniref:Uncharacterized protein n=1 Tax=Rhizophora mucronata TaxID=61149 RepID=A0A2P2KH13_RHIMU
MVCLALLFPFSLPVGAFCPTVLLLLIPNSHIL